ncbi:MAG: D-glycerate dehydrogenase [Novosphingobium sp.]
MPSSSEYRPTRRVEGKPRVIVTRRLSREQLVAALNAAHVLVPTVTDAIDAELIAQAGPQFGLIANFGAGTEHIDLAAARARKVIVTNTPGVFTDDTADMTIALIISVARRLNHGGRTLRAGKWEGWAPSTMLGHRLSGKTLGIVGMGRIGQAVAHRARAFGLNVAYFSRHRLPEAFETMLGATYVDDLDNLVAAADILTLHCPASPETLHMIDARRIALMKPDAYLVNTARGQLVDEEALIDALVAGRIGGAGLDVFEHEPQVDPRLLAHPNVAILPHMGSATFEGRIASGDKVIANIRFWADGHRPPDQVLQGLV